MGLAGAGAALTVAGAVAAFAARLGQPAAAAAHPVAASKGVLQVGPDLVRTSTAGYVGMVVLVLGLALLVLGVAVARVRAVHARRAGRQGDRSTTRSGACRAPRTTSGTDDPRG